MIKNSKQQSGTARRSGSNVGVPPEASSQGWASRHNLKVIQPHSRRRPVGRGSSIAAWLALIGLIIPAAEVALFIGNLKMTFGRLGISLLLFPALYMLLQPRRHLVLADLFVFATGIWMIGAALDLGGLSALSSAGAESLELCGGYVVARAFFFGPAALHTFMRVLKILAFAAIILAVADTASGRLIVHATASAITGVKPIGAQHREGIIRATSTFDHAILFGGFCSVVSAMLLYSEPNMGRRIVYVCICLFGCILSLSSSSLMASAMILATYAYDRLMRQYPWRWTALWLCVGALILAAFLVSNSPLGWILSHLTLEPESGYFRIMEWNTAIAKIIQAPWTGYAFRTFDEAELYSVDCVWLTLALRYGIPTIVFLFLANMATMAPTNSNNRTGDPYLDRMRTGFSLVLMMFMFVGLTVHYWNYMWIFWGLCMGIRASIREQSFSIGRRSISHSQHVLKPSFNALH